MQKFTFYWPDGKCEVLEGETPTKAAQSAGYDNGAIKALDFTIKGEDDSYTWDSENRVWEKKNGKKVRKSKEPVDKPFDVLKQLLPKQLFWETADFEAAGVDAKLPGLPTEGEIVVMPCEVYEDGQIKRCKAPKFEKTERGALIIKLKKGLKSRPTSRFVATNHDNGFVGFCELPNDMKIEKVTAFEVTDVFVGKKKYCLLCPLTDTMWLKSSYQPAKSDNVIIEHK